MMRSRSHEHEQPALELLDEYWFFSNTLASSNSKDQAAERGEFRQSSPPSSGSSSGHQQQQQEEVEVEDDDLNWSSIYEGVLRTRMAEGSSSSSRPAALRRAPSMPVPAAGGGGPGPASSTQPRSNRPMSQKQLARSRSISVFQHDDKNKCRRSSDLAGVDKDDQLRGSSLKKPAGNSSRPPALVRVQSEARSAAEVKDQLRMWAQAVACNVRQEC